MSSRTPDAMQAVADQLPPATHYCSDGLAIYTVECMNANLRTYLGRRRRKSRCFSRKLTALWRKVAAVCVAP